MHVQMANSSAPHPYYPVEAELIGYLANEWSVLTLLCAFAAGSALVLGFTLVVLSIAAPKLRRADQAAIMWFMLSGCIHLFFEGYFVFNHTRMAPAQDLFGQLWKEYSLSDSRYLTSDPFVLCMETITAILWGPFSFLLVYFIAAEHPLRHPLQLIVSVGQLYGDILYYATSMFDHYYNGLSYCRPEGYYFWCYYFFMNFIWIVIPSYYLTKSVRVMSRAVKYVNEAANRYLGIRLGFYFIFFSLSARLRIRASSNGHASSQPAGSISSLMPTPSTPRRPPNHTRAKSTPTKAQPLDIGQPLGVYDTNSVREKVRRWQQQGGGVVTEKDVGPESDHEQTPPEAKQQPAKDDTPRKRPGRSKNENKNKEGTPQRARSNSTPRKRVISDGHWRTNRSPPDTPPPKVTHRRKTDVFDRYADSVSSLGEKEKTQKDSGGRKSPSKPLPDDGIRVYAVPVRSAKNSPRPRSEYTYESRSILGDEEESAINRTPVSRRRSPKQRRGHDHDMSDLDSPRRGVDGELSTEASETVEFSEQENKPRRQAQKLPPKPLKPPRGGIFNHVIDESKKIFAKQEQPRPPPQNHGSSVEAWLSATPDPFVEEEELPVQVPAPLKAQSRREKSSSREHADEYDTASSSVPPNHSRTRRGSKGHNKRRSQSPTSTDASTTFHDDIPSRSRRHSQTSRDSRESSPSTLKRTGVKKHSHSSSDTGRMSTLRESLDEALQGSNLDPRSSSDGSEVSLSDRPPPLTLRRPFPGTGSHRLSTIMSVDTLSTATGTDLQPDPKIAHRTDHQADTKSDYDKLLESEARDQFDPNSLPATGSGLKRRLTTHADLISVLSIPGAGSRSIRSARSIRTNRSRLATATIGDIMQEFSSDETKYMRELRTLVGGVIPVLLTSVLSKSDSAVAAGLFRPSANAKDDENFTRPIVNMGISLERLKALHKRAPLNNPDSLLQWAQGAQKVYADYLKAWRLGFQDVVVNLAPPDDDPSKCSADTQSLYAGMAQDEDGDVVDGDGEKVDVAFLLKRPLVRLKYLAKTFKGINYIQTSPKAEEVAMVYQNLVIDARRRSNEERARLEDDSAASIDPTRARSPRTLAVLTDVSLHQTRRVRARDFFNLSLLHTSGQEIDCRAELLLRDNPPGEGPGGDLLICEVDDSGRWLLFPPVDRGRASARNGDAKGEFVVMIRGVPGEEKDWKELITLKTEDEQVGFEWVQMIGLSPVPPKISRSLSFLHRAKERNRRSLPPQEGSELSTISSQRTSSPTNVDVPFGEHATVVSRATKSRVAPHDDNKLRDPVDISANTPSQKPYHSSTPSRDEDANLAPNRTPTRPRLSISSPRSLNEAMDMAGGASPTTLKRSKAKRRSKYGELSMASPTSSDPQTPDKDNSQPDSPLVEPRTPDTKPATRPAEEVQPEITRVRELSPRPEVPKPEFQKPIARRSLSPVPSLELPNIPKLRKGSQKSSPPVSPKDNRPSSSPLSTPKTDRSRTKQSQSPEDILLRRDPSIYTEDVPVPPPHRSPSPSVSKQPTPVLSPTTPRNNKNRRSSSPLKHEYEPSTATESSESDTSTVAHYEIVSSSETSDEDLEEDDIVTPLPPIRRQISKVSPPASLPKASEETLAPSNSASQAPYKTVPSQPSKAAKSIASIFFWHDKGTWETLYPDECSIVITPGLIEAYEMSAAHSIPAGASDEESEPSLGRPLIALELTPLVPIRRGTALDISIRSPPTERSRIMTGNNIMFRSRNPEECEKLYGLINQSRINNPTYIALQNARGPYSTQPNTVTRQNSNSRSSKFGGWFSWYGSSSKSSYRATSAPTPSVAGVTDSSVGTMSSAFSALKKFGSGSKMFSIARSTITSRTGSGSLYSSSTRSGSNSTPNSQFYGGSSPEAAKNAAGGIGLTNAKIRLYSRESASKWRDMGAARLTILPASPVPSPPGTAGTNGPDTTTSFSAGYPIPDSFDQQSPSPPPTANAAPLRQQHEKRILIRGKTKGEVLLDACLGESCFERVARTGIAVSVWEEFDGVAKEGGVVGGSFRVYMIQMKSEAETAYTFGLVGKLRY
ncbi:hypothetical protein FQN55_003302 [Onygenales sp. PD_40]|nr:hypothetical protein FQN55_003302 [Onygenales sp. PD_40]KAK2797740.1 hypothetical protein FQN51_008319 [Onygenales sp. PD_10]